MNEVRRIPDGWNSCTLGDIVEFLDSERVPVNEEKRNKRTAGKPQSVLYPYYGANGQVGWIDGYLFDEPLVLLAEDGGFFETIGRVAYRIEGRTWVNNHAHVLRPLPGIDIGYVHFALNSMSLVSFVSGTTRLKLNQRSAQRIPIALAPQKEQKRIAARVEKLFGEIRIAKKGLQNIPDLTRRFRQSILTKAFRGELTERDPIDEPVQKTLERIKGERRSNWRDKFRRGKQLKTEGYQKSASTGAERFVELPKGWQWVRVGEVIASMKNGLYKPASAWGSGIPCLRMYNILHGKIVLKDVRRMRVTETEFEDYGLCPGDVLLNRINSRELVGKAAVVPDGLGKMVFEAMNIRIRVLGDAVNPHYMTRFLETVEARKRIELKVKQTVGMGTVDQMDIASWLLPLAPRREQEKIVSKINELLGKADILESAGEKGLENLQSLEKAVLSRAFRGELVSQDPNDELASVLLERVRVQRATTTKKGRSRTVLELASPATITAKA